MPIKFKVIERGQPGVPGGGKKKYYASANVNGELTLAGFTKAIEKISTVSGADIRAVLYAMVDVMKDILAEGKAVRLGDIGSLRINISSNGMPTAEEVNASCIKSSKVIFTPSKDSKSILSTLEYKKID